VLEKLEKAEKNLWLDMGIVEPDLCLNTYRSLPDSQVASPCYFHTSIFMSNIFYGNCITCGHARSWLTWYMWPGLTKLGLLPILNLLYRNYSFKYSVCALELATGCGYVCQLFTHFTPYSLPWKPSTVQAVNSKVSHQFLLGIDCIRRAWIWVGGGSQRQARWWF